MKQNKAALELVVGDQANDFTFDLDEYPPLLEGIKYVDATCIEIRPDDFICQVGDGYWFLVSGFWCLVIRYS